MAQDTVVSLVLGGVIDQLRQQSRKGQYLNNPTMWAKDVLGIHLWSKQREVMQSVQENIHTAVRSCHGSGKSLLASVIACWWIAVHPEGEAIVVTTAPTFAQVHAILWEEIRKHHLTAEQRYKDGLSPMKLPGYITQSDMWKSDSGQLLGFGRKPADNNDHGFHGIHRRYVLVLIDESCGIKENLFTAVEAITTTEGSRILAIGNPDDPATHFNKMFTKDENWKRIAISAFDSPNFTIRHRGHFKGCDDPRCLSDGWAARAESDADVPDELRPLLIQWDWVEQRRLAWGEGSSLWLSKVLGEFPLQSVNTLFNRETLNRGLNTNIKPLRSAKVVLGVDLSRFGPDYSTIYKFEQGPRVDDEGKPMVGNGGRLRLVDFWGGKADEDGVDGMESANRVHQWAQSLGADEVRIDAEGVGGPILDQIVRLSEGAYTVVAMRGSMASPDHFRWLNARAYWYDKAREAMLNNQIDMDPEDKRVEEELEQIQYHFKNRFSSLQIESKDDMAKRGLKSPDYADAAIYAMADMSYVIDDPTSRYKYGDRISMSATDFLGFAQDAGMISPY